ncbi:unnamed protein product [Calicophoron daubneyi]|uniref:Equilibrative nucleoside transporter 1 n=1 Tax=Calicophoron daubneyi TaxID=300641 RepID=A0AAV2TA89_CALDB
MCSACTLCRDGFVFEEECEVKSARPKKSDSFGVEDSFDEDSVLDKTSSCFKLIQCMRETWLPGACVFLTLFITLSLYPSILTKIRPMHDEPPTAWTTKFFIPVIVFLSFNICDWIGRFVSGLLRWPGRNQMRLTLLFCCLRIVLVILCLFMNQKPRVLLPAVFIHDAFPIILVIVLGLTNGYLFALSMMHGPSFASPGHSESAGLALSLYLSVGLGAGVAVSYGLVLLL